MAAEEAQMVLWFSMTAHDLPSFAGAALALISQPDTELYAMLRSPALVK